MPNRDNIAATAFVSGVCALLITATGHAAPFTLQNDLVFNCASKSSPEVLCAGGTNTHIEWRDGLTPVSELDIVSPANAPVAGVTPGDTPMRIAAIEHRNFVIPSAFAYSITLNDSFVVLDEGGGNTVVLRLPPPPPADGTTPLPIRFTESLNREPCPKPNPVGTTCDDFFSVTFPPGFFDAIPFSDAAGNDYFLRFDLQPGDGVSFDRATRTVFTGENQQSMLFITAQITTVPQPPNENPEPQSLLLFGLGLIGVGYSLRYFARAKK
jgi:PEP-CTERM motif